MSDVVFCRQSPQWIGIKAIGEENANTSNTRANHRFCHAEQRKVIAQELLQSISVGQDEVQELNAFLSGRIEEAERGELSEKNFSQIKHEARLDS